MLGVPLEGPAVLLGDNMSVIINTTMPSSVLKKKHNAIAYHRVREASAMSVLRFSHISSESNKADMMTKPLGNSKFHQHVGSMLFRVPRVSKGLDPTPGYSTQLDSDQGSPCT